MRGSSFKQIKLSKSLEKQKTAHKGFFCSAAVKSSSGNCLRAKTIVFEVTAAVVILYFTASEKENLRTERKQNYLIKNERKKMKPLTIIT